MKKILFSTICIIFLMSHSVYADTVKSSINSKSSDSNQTMSNEEFMKQWTQLENEESKAIAESIQVKADLEASKKRGKALDELLNQLDKNKKTK